MNLECRGLKVALNTTGHCWSSRLGTITGLAPACRKVFRSSYEGEGPSLRLVSKEASGCSQGLLHLQPRMATPEIQEQGAV